MASTPGLAQQPTHQLPTATELFNLRSACAKLAQKMSNEDMAHGAHWADAMVTSRYDSATDHCYVEADSRGIAGDINGQYDTFLYDGQTKELLAVTSAKNGEKVFGMVYANDPSHKYVAPSADNGHGFDDAADYIRRLMRENR
jgi:hypothetical protein